jgi:hypothetical protein
LGTVPNEKYPEVESKKGQYWKWVPLLEMGMPFPVLVNCAFGYLHTKEYFHMAKPAKIISIPTVAHIPK